MIILDSEKQIDLIKELITKSIKEGLSSINTNDKPYLTRKGIADYFGVSPTTVGNWVNKGMPVVWIDGRKLYGRDACSNWIASHQITIKNKKAG